MNDHELSAALRSFHVERTHLPDPPELHERVLALQFDDIGQRRSWLPLPSTWRFRTMFSATKYLVAGVTVALFGGLLLNGVLQTGPTDQTAPAAVATAEVTAGPTMEATTDRALLPGVDLEVEEVAPGIYRVLSEGNHDLTKHVWDVAATPDGDVWVVKQRVSYAPTNRPNHLRMRVRDARVLRLGDARPSFLAPDNAKDDGLRLEVHDGRPFVSGPSLATPRAWDGEGWDFERLPYCEGTLVAEMACWQWDSNVELGQGAMRMDLADGSEQTFDREDLGLDTDAWFGTRWTDGANGTVWTEIYDGRPWQWTGDSSTFAGLATYDGERWTIVGDAPAVDIDILGDLAVAPDGKVWIAGVDLDLDDLTGGDHQLIALTWDGEHWEEHGPLELGPSGDRPRIHFAPDGTVWFDPVTYFDGTHIRRLQLPSSVTRGGLDLRSYSYAPDGSVWAVLIDKQSPEELGCAAEPRKCEGAPGLFVITPEATAADGR